MSIGNQQLLQRYAQPQFTSSATDDVSSPFSFKDWYDAHQGVIPGQEFNQYNEYLVNWYKQKSSTTTDYKLSLRLNYLTLLKQLQLFFAREEAENWYNQVNLDNEKELLLSIPYFAKKLKDAALYYLQLRNNVKESRLKYNQTGTSSGLLQQLQKFLLTNYTKKPNTSISLPSSVWRDVPELSSIKDFITIQLEELYDTQNYFDQTPLLPVSAYYDINNNELEAFLNRKGLQISDAEWIYRLGTYALSSEFTDLSGENINTIKELSYQLSQKYLGQDKYTSLNPSFSTRADFYELEINEGNNFFYWPEGVYPSIATSLPRYKEIDINSTNLSSIATAGENIESADTIFIQTERGIEGAWLRNQVYDIRLEQMRAIFENSDKTVFRFPFAGYGLSAEDSTWTGYSLTYDPRFFFLDDELKQAVEEEYWSTNTSLTTITPININDTTLIKSGAYSNIDINRADRIAVWLDTPQYNATNFSGEIIETWLYRMNRTDISVGLTGDNVIVWPFEKIDPNAEFPNYYSKDLTDVCTSLPISSIDMPYAIAGDSLSSADVIYKVTNYKHTPEQAIECCWLSGVSVEYPENNLYFPYQGSFQLLAKPGQYTSFIWNGNDDLNIETVFKTIKHQTDCKFANTLSATYLDFDLCNCKQVMFVPFGHPGTDYFKYNSFTDFIIEGEYTPGVTDITQFVSTSAFAWYKTNSTIGFGDGRWFSGNNNSNNSFFLKRGKKYTYYRASAQTQDTETFEFPEYVVKHKTTYIKNNQIWMRGILNSGTWTSSDTPSNLTLTPGDILLYKRANTTKHSLTGLTLESLDITENRGSDWTNYDYVTLNEGKIPLITLSYPTGNYVDDSTNNTPLNYSKIVQILQWEITNPDNEKTLFKNTPIVLFTPTLTGTYSFAVTAMSAESLPPESVTVLPELTTIGTSFYYSNTGIYIFTNIPALTTTSELALVPSLTSYDTPVPGFVINTPLRGWDYGINAYNPYARAANAGAKPFWAKAYNEKNSATNYKGINTVGTPQRVLDKHNIITQPEFSELVLQAGSTLTYTRNYPASLTWDQPIELFATVNTNTWCTLLFNTTTDSNISYLLDNYKNELITTPTPCASQIKLRNYVDNKPVEVYYNAINSFIWNVSVETEIPETVFTEISTQIAIKANNPWTNLPNQFYPTVAAIPAINNLYSDTEIGGFFIPKNLGTSIYYNQNYTTTLDLTSPAVSSYFEDVTKYYNGRGLTLTDSVTPYINLINNNAWLKEPTVSGPIAGTIKKNIFKKYQKFIPYQSAYETNPRKQIGMLTPTSRQTPWGGEEDSEWKDTQNFPQSPTGELNVNAWANSQILKQTGLQLDNWCTDIFGNQYGLYKSLSGITPFTRKFTNGEVWVRKNNQFTSPASISLKNVFDTFEGTSLFNELTGKGIRKIDIFFDTLLIETSGAVIFEKINYDYTNDNIFSLTDEARYISLAVPVSTNLNREFSNLDISSFSFAQAGETWFFPEEKQVTQSICSLTDGLLKPELYQLDLNTLVLKKIFPITQEEIASINSLTALNLVSTDPPTLSHNSLRKEYLLTLLGKNTDSKDVLIEFKIKDLTQKYLNDIIVYVEPRDEILVDPPYISQLLQTNIEITNLEYLNALQFQCNVENGPAVFESINLPTWVTLSPSGLFSGTPPFETKQYIAEFKITNSIGSSYYSFIINVDYTEILTIYYLVTQGYPFDGYLVQQEHDTGDLDTGVIARIIE